MFDVVDLDKEKRADLLKMNERQLEDVELFCSRYPDIQLNFEVLNSDAISAGDPVKMTVLLEREIKDSSDLRPVDAPRYLKLIKLFIFTVFILDFLRGKMKDGGWLWGSPSRINCLRLSEFLFSRGQW